MNTITFPTPTRFTPERTQTSPTRKIGTQIINPVWHIANAVQFVASHFAEKKLQPKAPLPPKNKESKVALIVVGLTKEFCDGVCLDHLDNTRGTRTINDLMLKGQYDLVLATKTGEFNPLFKTNLLDSVYSDEDRDGLRKHLQDEEITHVHLVGYQVIRVGLDMVPHFKTAAILPLCREIGVNAVDLIKEKMLHNEIKPLPLPQTLTKKADDTGFGRVAPVLA